MCGSMADIQSLTAEIRRGIKKERRKKQHENIYGLPRATINNGHLAVNQQYAAHIGLDPI